VVLGESDRWLSMAPGTGLYWYEGSPGNVAGFLAALTGILRTE
jgi:hypothetical protein